MFRALLTSASVLAFATAAHATEELNALIWCDHADPGLLEPF